MFALQLRTRRSCSLSPVRSARHVVTRRSRSLGRQLGPVRTKRTLDEVFLDNDDDKWIFDPSNDVLMDEYYSNKRPFNDSDDDSQDEVMIGGSATPLLDFQLRPLGARRTWKNVLNKQHFEARIQQHRDATPHDDLGREVTEALRRTIRRQIEADSTLTPHSALHFVMQSDAFNYAFQSTTFTVSGFEEGRERLDTYIQALAQKLNSNQDFSPDDSFTMETTFIHTPSPGSGNGKKQRPGREAVETLLARKKSVVVIKNRDQLCCARTIVTMNAWVDHGSCHPNYLNLRKGRPVQGKKAKELHSLAGVPEGPCGVKELQKFQDALPGYQIKVLAVDKPHSIIFCGKTPSHRRILLIKVDGHYHGCNSYGGFLSRSYLCHDCNRGYNTEDIDNHPCHGQWCRSCERADCPDFQTVKSVLESGQVPAPSLPCGHCHRSFFGKACYSAHKVSSSSKYRPLCDFKKKCLQCHKVCETSLKRAKRGRDRKNVKFNHKCGWGECPFCEIQVDERTQKPKRRRCTNTHPPLSRR